MHHGRGRAVQRSRSSLAMPHRKPVGRHAHTSLEKHHSADQPMPPRDIGSCCSSCNSCEHMRSAAVTCAMEHEHVMHRNMHRRALARRHRPAHRFQAKGSAARAPADIAAAVVQSAALALRRRKSLFNNGRTGEHGIFNGESSEGSCSPRCGSGTRGMRCRGGARAFARSKLVFSE